MNESDSCHAFADHLHHEHSRLHKLLLEIGHDVAELTRPDQPPAVREHLAQRLADLRQQLQSHYAEEEAGGCLEEAVTRCPSLANDTKANLEEHPLLDRMLYRVIAQISDPAAKPAELQQSWQAFYNKIHVHEAAETRLLQMAFGAETADFDVETNE